MHADAEFVPARFTPYEFDPPADDYGGVPSRRWLHHWDGRVGKPAQALILAWASGTATVLVCTDGRRHDDSYARFLALHIAIGNENLPAVVRHYENSQERIREIKLHSDADNEWGPSADGDRDAVVTAYRPEFVAGYKFVDRGTVFFVANKHMPFRVRMVAAPQSYDFDPTRRFPLHLLGDRLAADGY